LSLFINSVIRKLRQIFSVSKRLKRGDDLEVSSISHELQTNILLVSANSLNRDELTKQLNNWDYQIKSYKTVEELTRSYKHSLSKIPFKALIIDHRQLNIDPKIALTKLQNLLLPNDLTTILVGPQQPQVDQALLSKAGFHYQVATPLDTRGLFTALHSPIEKSINNTGITTLFDKFNDNYPRLPAKKILLATHDSNTTEIAKTILEDQGHTVTLVNDGQQALQILEKKRFDIAVIDKELPVLSGIQVINIHHLDCPADQWMPSIFLLEEENGVTENYQLHATKAYLTKPINSQQLIKTLYTCFQKRDTQLNDAPQPQRLKYRLPYYNDITLVEHSTLKELDDMGSNDQFIHQIIHLFTEEGRITIQELKEAVKLKDFILFKEATHLLLDSSSFLGTKQLYRLALHASKINQTTFEQSATLLVGEISTIFNATQYEMHLYLTEKKESRPYS
jgi:two-component system sensor histidine kinase/response regulator